MVNKLVLTEEQKKILKDLIQEIADDSDLNIKSESLASLENLIETSISTMGYGKVCPTCGRPM